MDPNSAIGGVATQKAIAAVDAVLDRALSTMPQTFLKLGKALIDQLVVDFRIGFRPYLQRSYDKCQFYKTIINPHERLDLVNSYVHVNLSNNRLDISDDKIIDLIGPGCRRLITGFAGTGKSMFMKYATIVLFEKSSNLIPIFIELREINRFDGTEFVDFLHEQCNVGASSLTRLQFERALLSGVFALILDGLDEVIEAKRVFVEASILKMDYYYTATSIIVSSRPEARFGSWARFAVHEVRPLSQAQSISLIRNLPLERGLQQRFIAKILNKLWDSHEAFLSIPLLATIMVLTYEDFAEVPDKIQVFYSQAFDVLYGKHDALKAQYVRETKTDFKKNGFKRCSAAFGAFSYLEERFVLSDSLACHYAERAIEYINKDSDLKVDHNIGPEDLLHDLEKCLCILQRDGTDITFLHRSFQEYLAAYFAANYHDERFRALIDRFAQRPMDNVIPMTFDIAKSKMERDWVAPTLSDYRQTLESMSELHQRVEFIFQELVLQVDSNGDARVGATANGNLASLMSLAKIYPQAAGIMCWKHIISRIDIKSVISKKNYGYPRYDELAVCLIKGKVFRVEPDHGDDWWLRELGFEKVIGRMLEEISTMEKNVESQRRGREDIVEMFL